MARRPLVRTTVLPYHVCARSNNKEWFYLPTKRVWEIFLEKLRDLQISHDLKIHIFVLMSNHFHMIVTTPKGDLDAIMLWLQREVSRAINREAIRINHVFGGPYKWSVIQHSFYYKHAFRYVAQNPLKEGLASRVEEYPFSTLTAQHSALELPIEITPACFDQSRLMDKPMWAKLDWLNTPYFTEEYECVRRAIRRRAFAFKKDRIHHKIPASLELVTK